MGKSNLNYGRERAPSGPIPASELPKGEKIVFRDSFLGELCRSHPAYSAAGTNSQTPNEMPGSAKEYRDVLHAKGRTRRTDRITLPGRRRVTPGREEYSP